MRLGELIEFLKGVDPAIVCRFGFNNPHSYRGYYEDLAFEPAENVTVGEMLAAAESALGETFTGYKGGDYTMSEYTDCWLANYGEGIGEGIGPILLRYMTGDASNMVGEAAVSKMETTERCGTCQHDPNTCDRAECPAWGKSEEAKARIIIDEANRPLTDEECAIVDAGYERGKRILAEVKAEERERRLAEALDAIISNIEDRLDQPHGDDHVNLTLEHLADIARSALAEMEGK